ncbi:MAG: winged helix DNA-binding domain-containing protein [Acidimicrobiia bacterium]
MVECVRATAGLYGTAPTCYLSLAARVEGFHKRDLDLELYERRSLRRMRALRGSGFMIPVEMINVVVSAEDREGWYGQHVEKVLNSAGRNLLEKEVLQAMKGRIVTTRELRQELALEGARAEALKYLMAMLTGQQRITSAGVVGGWRSNQFRYALWEEWFPAHPPQKIDAEMARVQIANWYLSGHGPATLNDFKWWSGLKKENARIALESSEAVMVSNEDDPMYDLPGRPDAPTPSGLRLLPVWDTAIVTQESRRRMVDPSHYRFVYDFDGNATSTVVIDGSVAGVWDRKGDNKRLIVKAAPLTGFGSAEWDAIETEASVIGRAVGADEVDVVRMSELTDLQAAGRNRFLSPLSGQ